MTDDVEKGLGTCGLCKEPHSLHIRVINGVTVGRCINCDVAPCNACKGKTLDPAANKCRHCDAPLRLKVSG